jgi:phage-related protein (TIGR01555 family)
MSRKKKRRGRRGVSVLDRQFDNSFFDLAVGLSAFNGIQETLSSYGTIEKSNNYSLITLNLGTLTYLYTSSGLIQTAIQLPVQDALSRGINYDSGEMDNEEIDILSNWMEDVGAWTSILNSRTWARLYGGGAVILNCNQNYEKPLNWNNLENSPIQFYSVDCWQLSTDDKGSFIDYHLAENNPEYYFLYGLKIHKSRVFPLYGKEAPYYIKRQLRGWGMSEVERMIRDLNIYLKTDNVLYEILDEAKVDVYKIEGLASKLMNKIGTQKVTNRIQTANQIKNYINALVLDSKEDYQQKNMTFTGLSEVKAENRIGIAAALRMPLTKLFGLSASGFNTGESDLENYNSMVESEERKPLKRLIRWMSKIGCSKLFGYIPDFSIEWPPLRVLTAEQEETIKRSRSDTILSWFDREIIDAKEAMEQAKQDKIFTIETEAEAGNIDGYPMGNQREEVIE